MLKNDREVFEHLIADKETPLQIDFITYAVFAHEKREWIKLYESQNDGHSPEAIARHFNPTPNQDSVGVPPPLTSNPRP